MRKSTIATVEIEDIDIKRAISQGRKVEREIAIYRNFVDKVDHKGGSYGFY